MSLLLIFVSAHSAETNISAFPGAEGFGAVSVGGRGGRVIHVTNLNSKGPGSLQWACDQKGPRIVVFDVSGVIKLPGRKNSKPAISIRHSNIYIAGQTAPGAGITIQGKIGVYGSRDDPSKRPHDITIRFIRCRPITYDGFVTGGRSLEFIEADRVIADHVSTSWGVDEQVLFFGCTQYTVQWNTIEESGISFEGSGQHNYGMLLGYTRIGGASLHHNLFAHHSERAPACTSLGGLLDYRNNVIYNLGSYGVVPTGNAINNYCKPGPGGPIGMRSFLPPTNLGPSGITVGKGYINGNYFSAAGRIYDARVKVKKRQDKAFPTPPVTTHSAEEAYRLVLAHAGCLPRDAVTRRNIHETRAGIGHWGRQNPDGGLMARLTPGKPPRDTDQDGMPDEWEKAHGLNPNDPKDSSKVVPAGASKDDRHKGYTCIEFYVNDLADKLIAKAIAEDRDADFNNVKPGKRVRSLDKDIAEAGVPGVVVGMKDSGRKDQLKSAEFVAAGSGHVLVRGPGRRIWSWGLGWYGQLGRDDSHGADSNFPVAVLAPDGKEQMKSVRMLTAGGQTSVALLTDGSLCAWGGSVGDGSDSLRRRPVKVKGPGEGGLMTDVTDVCSGVYHTVCVRRDGSVWCWGLNDDGQLGDGTTEKRNSPVQVRGLAGKGFLAGIVSVAAGAKHCVALAEDGTVWTWGDNVQAQCGDGTLERRCTPVRVKGLKEAVTIAAGWYHTVAIKADGTVWSWGDNHLAQLGNPARKDRAAEAGSVRGPDGKGFLTDAKAVACGGLHNFILRHDGTLWSWGYNNFSQLGVGDKEHRQFPTQVLGPLGNGHLSGVIAVAGGGHHNVAVLKDESIFTWGNNTRGQIGDGRTHSWFKDGQYVDPAGRSTREMYKSGARNLGNRPWPTPVSLPDERVAALLDVLRGVGPGEEKSIAKAVACLEDKDILIRRAAIAALGRIGHTTDGVLVALDKALANRDARVREDTVEVLRIFASDAPAKAIPLLIKALEDKVQRVQVRAIKALGRLGAVAGDAVPAMWKLAEYGKGKTSSESFDMLGEIGAPSVPTLAKALTDHASSRIRRQAALSLAIVGPKAVEAVPALIKGLEDKDPDVRSNAAWALSKVGPGAKAAISALKKLLQDENKKARYNAGVALKRIQSQ